eukprot:6389180-Pyramimonas_sp.AAC.2
MLANGSAGSRRAQLVRECYALALEVAKFQRTLLRRQMSMQMVFNAHLKVCSYLIECSLNVP